MAEFSVKRPVLRQPTHPGQVLKRQVFPALNLDIKAAAKALGISRNTLHGLIRDASPNRMTAPMALRVAKLCGNDAEMWLNMQRTFDLWEARQDQATKDAVAKIPTMVAAE